MADRMRVKLKCHYTDEKGGGNVPGDVCMIPTEVAQRLIRSGLALPVATLPANASQRTGATPAVTKPGIPTELKGLERMRWLREKILASGATPSGRKLAELEAQYLEVR
jgi:hypothetical protein